MSPCDSLGFLALLRTFENSLDVQGNLWDSLGTFRTSWEFLGLLGDSWGLLWIPWVFLGPLDTPRDSFGHPLDSWGILGNP